jgi:acetoin utilization deacetylase AcuC-like enzyme
LIDFSAQGNKMKTVYTFIPSREHEYLGHPESPGRLDALDPLLARLEGVERIEALPATEEQVARVHQPKLIKVVQEICKQRPGIVDHAPTYVTQTSYQDALLAAGGVLACTRAVLNGDAKNAFAIVRPPGHHAEPDHVMGFCIFNNIAIAAREALAGGMRHVMVIDYDAHHGSRMPE